MSQELIPFGQQTTAVSADIFASIFKGVATLEKKYVEKFPHLSFRGGKFHGVVGGDSTTFVDEENVPVNRLDVIVVGIPQSRSQVLFPKYDPENPAAPLCASINGRTPDANIEHPFSSNCQTCEKRIKVRGEDGRERSPCQQMLNLAVVVNGQPDKIYKCKLPITSIYNKESENADYKAWDQYSDFLRRNGVMHPAQVVTRISFDPNAQYPRPVFKAVGHLTQEMLQAIAPAIQSEVTREIVSGSPEQLGTGEARPTIENKPAELPKIAEVSAQVVVEKPAPVQVQAEASKPVVDPEAEIRAKIEAQVRAEMEAKLAAQAQAAAKPVEVAPEPTEAPKKAAKAKAVVVESDADLDDALSDW